MVTNSVTVLSKYGCHGYNGDQNFISPYNVNQFSSEGYFFCNSFVYLFFFSSPLCSNSPLRAELVPKTTAKQQQRKNTSQKGQFCPTDFLFFSCLSLINARRSLFLISIFLGIKTGVRDQPLTFNSRVKSSGYTAATPRHVSLLFVLYFYYFILVLSMDKSLIFKE